MRISTRIIQFSIITLLAAGRLSAQHDHAHAHAPAPATAPATAPGEDGHADEVHLTADAIRRHGIKTEPVKRHVLVPTFTAPARVSFNTEAMAHVGSVLRGRVVELKVRVGDAVKKGDELFIIESPELAEAQSDFLLKRTEAEVATIAVEPAKRAYDRAKTLHEQNEGMSLAEVQRRETEWRGAQGKLTAAKGAATAAENKLHALGMNQAAVERLAQTKEIDLRVTVAAPLAGQVIEREITLGELVNPDRDALLVLADLSTLWVIADVPEARLAEVAVGSSASVQLAARPQDRLEGKVTYISPSLNAETRTASVRIEVPNGGSLLPGMFARAEITAAVQGGNSEAVLAVPADAVLTVEGEAGVFVPVEGEENTFAKRAVKVGKAVGRMVPVFEGLAEGQQVVTSGAFILKAELGKGGAAHEH